MNNSLASFVRKFGRRRTVAAAVILILLAPALVVVRPGVHLWQTAKRDIDELPPVPAGYADDASRLNLTAIQEIRSVPSNPAEAESALREWLLEARENDWKVSIAGARHTMGGHTIVPDGLVIDMLPLGHMKLDADSDTLHVGAGALWKDVLQYLDEHGRSVAVMQSNNSFSIGGSISANCHGWQVGRPPIASTVQSFHIMLADGSVLRCSPAENSQLFSAALGGYGLFGIILDADLKVVPNRRYHLSRQVLRTADVPTAWEKSIAAHAGTEMVYARLNVMADDFLNDAALNVFYVDTTNADPVPAMHESRLTKLRRNVFRGSADSEYGKRLRWQAELEWQPKLGGNTFSRNQLLNEGVEVFQNRSAGSTDILHEYFVPRQEFEAFVARMREIVPKHRGDLLNVTVRSIETDDITLLRYADQPVYSLVMLFQQRRNADAEAKMDAMTRELIDAALELGGRYYLPYRLHATTEQFRRAYPNADEFFALKKTYDASSRFENQFYLKYAPKH
jgi:FAD/FMN-containing dehydrogenase